MRVEVVYADPQRQISVELSLADDAVVRDALHAVATDPQFLGIDVAAHAVGIYGQRCELDQRLRSGDRVEVYRELSVDAKAARRQRAQLQQEGKQQSRHQKQVNSKSDQ